MQSSVTNELQARLREVGIDPTCRRAGVPPTTVFRWLRGGGGITLAQAEAIAEALGARVVVAPAKRARRPSA
jgi:DNA-binding phage protein